MNTREDSGGVELIPLLLAEDDPTNQYVYRAILTAGGYRVEVVENGLRAVERAPLFRPRLILLDMMMPVMDGYEAASRLSGDPRLDDIPIIALTAKAMKGDLEKCLEAGCDDYLSKPVERQLLLARLEAWRQKTPAEWMPARLARRRSRAA